MMPFTKIRQFNALLTTLGMQDEKRYLIAEASAGRTSSTKELTLPEMDGLIAQLNSLTPKTVKPGDKQRKRIISMAHELGWRNTGKADMPRINEWCISTGQYKKPLMEHSVEELSNLVAQFTKMYNAYFKI